MRVLLLTQWFQPEPTFKGMPFARGLADRGHTVEVLTGFPNYPGGRLYPGYRVRLWQTEVTNGIRVNRVALYPSHDRSGLRRALNYFSFASSALLLGSYRVQRPDVIYVYNLATLMPAALWLRARYGAKVLLDVQDLWPESVASSGMVRNGTAMRFLHSACTWLYRQADWITVLSPGFRRALAERGVQPDHIEVIYNWCDETSLRPVARDESLANELGLAGKFTVLYAGTMGVMQDLNTVLEAALLCAETVPQARFVLLGDGVDRSRLEARAAAMDLANVRFLQPQPPQAMGRFYALAEALLVHLKDDPLFRITIPSKTQAYLYMGKPIVMAVQGDAADLVRQAGAGVVCPAGDPAALADVITKLAALPVAERERLGEAGASFYTRHLAMQTGIDRFERRMRALVDHNC